MSKKQMALFISGGIGYGFLEILWRGYTHWTMVLTGGFCLNVLTCFFQKFKKLSTIVKALCGAGIITAVELVVGIIANKIFHLKVWDYSKIKGNFLGQICPQFSFIWFLLCLPIVWIFDAEKLKL